MTSSGPARGARVPPHSVEAEAALLGAILITPANIPDVAGKVAPVDFYNPRNRRIYEAAVDLQSRDEPVDVATVAIESGVPRRRLAELLAECPASSNALAYAQVVGEMAWRRRTIEFARRLEQASNEGDPEAVLALLHVAEADAGVNGSGTWDLVDLAGALAGDCPAIEPTLLGRDDGNALLYAGKVHSFHSEPEAGKTWLALAACAERLDAGEHVLYLDFEDNAVTIVGRLRALGVAADVIEVRFCYINPAEPLGAAAAAVFGRVLAAVKPSLVVIDGVTEALVLNGWDLCDNMDIARFNAALPRRAARAGAAVAILDHVGRDKEARGRFAIGGQHKLAGVDVAYGIEVLTPFGRGREGVARLKVMKDRPGGVRQHATSGTLAGELHVGSNGDGRVHVEVRSPAPEGDFRPTCLMEKVSRLLELELAPVSTHTIEERVRGKAEYVRRALACLAADGYVAVEEGPRGARLHRSVKRFREVETDD